MGIMNPKPESGLHGPVFFVFCSDTLKTFTRTEVEKVFMLLYW